MQNKRSLYKHLIFIYVLYFVILVGGFMMNMWSSVSSGVNAQKTFVESMQHDAQHHPYYVVAHVLDAYQPVEGASENLTASVNKINLRILEPGELDSEHAFRIIADSKLAYALSLFNAIAYLAIFVLIALIINSLRKSIRDEHPLAQRNIWLTRTVGILMIIIELCTDWTNYINQTKAAELLAESSYEVISGFTLNSWNLIIGLMMLFMAEILSIGAQLNEEQKFTI